MGSPAGAWRRGAAESVRCRYLSPGVRRPASAQQAPPAIRQQTPARGLAGELAAAVAFRLGGRSCGTGVVSVAPCPVVWS
eukprot:scaffold3152_cov376-Prasinococcus_capsulatus_cf.AAC.1